MEYVQDIHSSFQQFNLYLADMGQRKAPSHEDSLLTSFTTSFLSMLVCEVGDKTFFLAMILAMKYKKIIIFIGAWGSLILMTVVSAVGGKLVFSLLPKLYTNIIVVVLFFYFGIRLIYEAYHEEAEEVGQNEQLKQVDMEIREMQQHLVRKSMKANQGLIDEQMSPQTKKRVLITDRMILTQAFIMTFLAEWGDRSQIATIALAASYNLFMVNIGAILGHFVCTAAAVQIGDWISKRISEKHVHYAGGIVFILSGIITLIMMFQEGQTHQNV